MKLLGDVGHVESRFVQFGDKPHKSLRTHPMELLCDVGHVESPFDPFGDSVSFGA
jgi:hypothetical protein